MIKTKVAFLEGRLFFNQSELFQYFLNSSDWLDKSRLSKKSHFYFDYVNRLIMALADRAFTPIFHFKTPLINFADGFKN